MYYPDKSALVAKFNLYNIPLKLHFMKTYVLRPFLGMALVAAAFSGCNLVESSS